MTQISAIERLQILPAVFRGADLTLRFQWTSKTASQYLLLWKKRGLVAALGGHSDVFCNLLVNQHADWEKALLMAMPSALVVGVEALRRQGWTTQVPAHTTVAVNAAQYVYKTSHFEVLPRPRKWFATVKPGLNGHEAGALNWLSPAWALADLLRQADWGEFGLWPDDIEWDQVSERDEQDWMDACLAFGLDLAPLLSFEENSRSEPAPGR